MKRVTGIGGIFFKCENPEQVREWYATHLGLEIDQYGTSFEWRHSDDPTQKGFTAWSPFKASTTYFEPSPKEFMVNYRVENLEALLDVLRSEGVTVIGEIQVFEYGKFAHILDIEGNKLELWEPVDEKYDDMIEARTF
ncbi:MAG: VOC family protein [Saprospiraceae bacterium]|nr:VOC family protein [Saprospiraceae bacterium]